MTTTAEMALVLNKFAAWHKEGIRWTVQIVDARVSWGKTQYEITPFAGDGRFWVDGDRVSDVRDVA